mmetsp:Transcript_26266/g.41102  ORF Transcript_26266/g.41102 Transcript_26266/m.41102 type:complete len:597 (+) Transcript_26266:25-1815(+)
MSSNFHDSLWKMSLSGSFVMTNCEDSSAPHQLRDCGCSLGAVKEFAISKVSNDGETFPNPNQDVEFMHEGEVILEKVVLKPSDKEEEQVAFVRAGPRERIVFEGTKTKIGIVTAGGLCPGLNTVIQGIVMDAHHVYKVPEGNILGIRGGFRGFTDPQLLPPLVLTPKLVKDIHNTGGTFLGSNRGGFDKEAVLESAIEMGLDVLFVIGGDGSHAAATLLAQEALRRGLKFVVVGIPKTIDNDIVIIDRSFGFDTAVQEAVRAIKSAKIEAAGCLHGVGIVKLMGRSCGYLTAHATLASRDVDICLIPEVDFVLEGPTGVWAHIRRLLRRQGHAVIVIAEGTPIKKDRSPSSPGDEGAENVGLSGTKSIETDVGKWFRDSLKDAMKQSALVGECEPEDEGRPFEVAIKYIDPSYMVRSVPANVGDSIYCSLLASQAVHGAFSGFTSFTVGLVHNRTCYIPMQLITAGTRKVNPKGRTWQRICANTQQPHFGGVLNPLRRAPVVSLGLREGKVQNACTPMEVLKLLPDISALEKLSKEKIFQELKFVEVVKLRFQELVNEQIADNASVNTAEFEEMLREISSIEKKLQVADVTGRNGI